MAVTRTPLLTPAATAGATSVITVDAGTVIGLGLYVTAGRIPPGVCPIKVKTSGANASYDDTDDGTPFGLSRYNIVRHFHGPIELIVERPEGMEVGIEQLT